MAHESGPWRWRHLEWDDRRPPFALEGGRQGTAVLQIRMDMDGDGRVAAYFEADGPDTLRLIAEAPELLRRCRLVRDGLENLTTQDFFEGRVEELCALLAEAVDRVEGPGGAEAGGNGGAQSGWTPSLSKKNFT